MLTNPIISRLGGQQEVIQKTGFGEVNGKRFRADSRQTFPDKISHYDVTGSMR
jgi:hypothetical protein